MDAKKIQALTIGTPIKIKGKNYCEPRYDGFSKSGKRVAVTHNYLFPFGIGITTVWVKPESIE